MRKISKVSELIGLKLEVKVLNVIEDQLKILGENYRANRNVDKDLGGYILVVESLEDVKELKNGMLKYILPEYTDKIIYSEGVNYTF